MSWISLGQEKTMTTPKTKLQLTQSSSQSDHVQKYSSLIWSADLEPPRKTIEVIPEHCKLIPGMSACPGMSPRPTYRRLAVVWIDKDQHGPDPLEDDLGKESEGEHDPSSCLIFLFRHYGSVGLVLMIDSPPYRHDGCCGDTRHCREGGEVEAAVQRMNVSRGSDKKGEETGTHTKVAWCKLNCRCSFWIMAGTMSAPVS